MSPVTSTAAHIDIARVYLESGDVKKAHSWIRKIPEEKNFQEYKRDQLLEIYQKQGNTTKLTDLLCQKFRSYHSIDTLQAFMDVIGYDKRDQVIRKPKLCRQPHLSLLVALDSAAWIYQGVPAWYPVFEEAGQTVSRYNRLEEFK